MQTPIHRDSKPWQVQVWASFLIAVFLCAVRWLYLITCSFTLAKTLRDRHKADWSQARLAERQSHHAAAVE